MKVRVIHGIAIAMTICCSYRTVGAQNESISGATKPQMMAKDANPDWEVVTVKPNNSGERRDQINIEGRHVIVRNETAEAMMVTGFNVHKTQLMGLPDWTKTERWDADGVPTVEGRLDVQQWQSMIRKLLEERFGLKLHHEQQEMSAFALKAAKNGPKLTENLSDPKGVPIRNVRGGSEQRTDTFTNTSMADLTSMLLFSTDRPIVDRTALNGRYDFKLQWTVNEGQTTAPNAPPGLLTAIQEQLGLKLEPVKATVDVLVVDRVHRPGPN